jgi:hypothetical protein
MEKAVSYWLLAFSLAGDVAIDIGQPDPKYFQTYSYFVPKPGIDANDQGPTTNDWL